MSSAWRRETKGWARTRSFSGKRPMEKGECVIATVRRVVPSTRVKETGAAFVVDMVVGIIDGFRAGVSG
jgi:hypothetical protein